MSYMKVVYDSDKVVHNFCSHQLGLEVERPEQKLHFPFFAILHTIKEIFLVFR